MCKTFKLVPFEISLVQLSPGTAVHLNVKCAPEMRHTHASRGQKYCQPVKRPVLSVYRGRRPM